MRLDQVMRKHRLCSSTERQWDGRRPAGRFAPRWLRWLALSLVAGWLFAVPSAAASEPASPESLQFFESHVRPLFAQHCYECHSQREAKKKAGLTVDSRDGLLAGGDSGEAVVPGDPAASLLVEALRYESYEMPPTGKLPEEDIAKIVRWIEMGAPWPEEPEPISGEPQTETFELDERKQNHWAWQPIQNPVPPTCDDDQWIRNDIDAFVLAELEQASLSPAPPADRLALIRRLSFDLLGLPPTPDQIRRYLHDPAEDVYERMVDELLNSPRFGERWGRHWLDLVRYAESRGHEFDNDAPNAFQYRDYVIRALNADLPYDQFIREHIAGDLLQQPRLHPEEGFNESILGTGFWFLGEGVHSPVDIRKDEADRFDNMIDVMSKTFLGMTVACARCHDHKFDAIGAADYYALSGFLQSSDYRQVRFDSIEQNRHVAAELQQLDQKFNQRIQTAIADAGLLDDSAAEVETDESPASAPTPTADSPRVVVDYADLPSEGWMQDGFIYGGRPQHPGELFLQTDETGPRLAVARYAAARSDSFWDGLVSRSAPATNQRGRLATLPRSGRTLRTPTFEVQNGQIGCRVRGQGAVVACVDSHRLIAGPLHGETVKEFSAGPDNALHWVSLNLNRYIGHRVHLEFTPAQNATLEILRVVDGQPFETVESKLAEQDPAAIRLNDVLQESGQSPSDKAGEIHRLTRQWSEQRTALQQQIRKESRLAMAMMDGWSEDDHLLIRGSTANPGEIVPRRFLAAIDSPAPMAITGGSGRLQLAERINAPENPLTSRVIINRIWHHLLGRGIVPTTDDFGVLGQPPTHPELLDHLATWFTDNGQSIKKTIRYIVQSHTYRMSSRLDAQAFQIDPENHLWHHLPPKRLEGEAIRDALLAISGELDPSLFGEPVPIHLTSFMQGRGRPSQSGPLDGDRRRSIYIAVRRNFLSPLMLAFDTPAPFSTMGRRNVSNVPAQALILMNDPFVFGRAKQWAERAIREVPHGTEDRIRWMYETAYARPATQDEVQLATAFLNQQSEKSGQEINAPALWSDLAHALINSKEFIFLR